LRGLREFYAIDYCNYEGGSPMGWGASANVPFGKRAILFCSSNGGIRPTFLKSSDRSFWVWWDHIEEQHADDPRALLEALLSEIAKRIGRPAYRGCPFLNLTTEFPDQNHPGRVIARNNKEEMRARLATIVAKLGAGDPARVASQIALIINGAFVTGLMAEPADLRGDLVDAAMKLLA
jgi:hypothetical protein